jgi:hypothetical protein
MVLIQVKPQKACLKVLFSRDIWLRMLGVRLNAFQDYLTFLLRKFVLKNLNVAA